MDERKMVTEVGNSSHGCRAVMDERKMVTASTLNFDVFTSLTFTED